MEIGNTVYEKIDKMNGIQFAKSAEILSKIDLKPISLLVAGALDNEGKEVDTQFVSQLFKNGFLAESLSEILAKIGSEYLIQDMAALMVVPKGSKFSSVEDFEESHTKVRDALLLEDHEKSLDLAMEFLKKNKITNKILENYSLLMANPIKE
jgi:hypothetical protein